jgi:hypothetical protein
MPHPQWPGFWTCKPHELQQTGTVEFRATEPRPARVFWTRFPDIDLKVSAAWRLLEVGTQTPDNVAKATELDVTDWSLHRTIMAGVGTGRINIYSKYTWDNVLTWCGNRKDKVHHTRTDNIRVMSNPLLTNIYWDDQGMVCNTPPWSVSSQIHPDSRTGASKPNPPKNPVGKKGGGKATVWDSSNWLLLWILDSESGVWILWYKLSELHILLRHTAFDISLIS